MSPKRDWRDKAIRVEEVLNDHWYRSPLWQHDHALGHKPEFIEDGVAWCGRPLRLAMEGWGDEVLEGLWLTNRTAAKCSTCKRMEKEWHAQEKTR